MEYAITEVTANRPALNAAVDALLPETTLDFFRSPEAADVIRAIQHSDRLIHH